MKGKSLISIVLILAIATFAAASMNAHAHSDPQDYVKVYVYNPATGDNIYPAIAYPSPTYVEVWIDSPLAWEDTASGIVGYTVSLQVDPSVVEVLTAQKYPDTDFDRYSNGFLTQFLVDYFYIWDYDTSFLKGTIDKPTGTITGTAEAIMGFTTLGVGAGGGPQGLMQFVIRTKSGVDHTTAYSPITLFDCYYTTVDGTKHAVDIVESGHYGTPVPEFPLGMGLITALTPIIALIYLWRRKEWKK